jgi:hypothetical protein
LEPESGDNLELLGRARTPMTWYQSMGHKGPVLRPRCIGIERAQTELPLFLRPRALIYAPDDAARGSLPIDRTVLVAMQRLRAIYSSFFTVHVNK